MIWEILENYLVTLIIGAIIGAIAIRYYYENSKNYALGKTIEGAMISSSVDELKDYCSELDLLLSKMRSESDTLLEQIKRCKDIENIVPKVNDFEIEAELHPMSEESENEGIGESKF